MVSFLESLLELIDAPCVLSKNGNTVVLTLAVTKTFPKHFGLHTLLMSH